MDNPAYKHDCTKCIFLGKHRYTDGRIVDLYYCEKCDGGTGIARFGNNGSDYASAPRCVVDQLNENNLVRIAIEKYDKLMEDQNGNKD
jgi:hypothetical protein